MLSTNEFIGEIIDPLDVDAGVNLVFTFTGEGLRPTFWTIVNGQVAGDTNPDFPVYGGIPSDPPGVIIYNGVVIGGPESEFIKDLRSESFFLEVNQLLGDEYPVFSLWPFFFTHQVVLNKQYYPQVVSFEFLNQGGVKIHGMPEGANEPFDVNILLEQDEPFRAKKNKKKDQIRETKKKDAKKNFLKDVTTASIRY